MSAILNQACSLPISLKYWEVWGGGVSLQVQPTPLCTHLEQLVFGLVDVGSIRCRNVEFALVLISVPDEEADNPEPVVLHPAATREHTNTAQYARVAYPKIILDQFDIVLRDHLEPVPPISAASGGRHGSARGSEANWAAVRNSLFHNLGTLGIDLRLRVR
jgi:hypothetical protein